MNTYCFHFKPVIRGMKTPLAIVVAESEHEARDFLADFLIDIDRDFDVEDVERVEVLREGDIRLS